MNVVPLILLGLAIILTLVVFSLVARYLRLWCSRMPRAPASVFLTWWR